MCSHCATADAKNKTDGRCTERWMPLAILFPQLLSSLQLISRCFIHHLQFVFPPITRRPHYSNCKSKADMSSVYGAKAPQYKYLLSIYPVFSSPPIQLLAQCFLTLRNSAGGTLGLRVLSNHLLYRHTGFSGCRISNRKSPREKREPVLPKVQSTFRRSQSLEKQSRSW